MTASARFETFDASHLTALAAFVVGALVLIAIGRNHRGTDAAERFSKVFALLIPLFTIPLQILQFTPAEWNLNTSLPLQLCDLAWIVAIYALWTHRSWAVAVTYLWGITLTSQAIITPDLATAFPEPRFLMFWAMHLLIIWSAFYLTFGLGLALTWSDFRVVAAITGVWAVVAFVFNLIVGTNYGYLNAKPAGGSILDLLGPWPWYVLFEIAIILVVWALLVWPWARRDKRSRIKS